MIIGYEGEKTPLDWAVHDKLTIGHKVPCVRTVVPTRTSDCTIVKTTSGQLATHVYENTKKK